jgi:hypothetical protein
MSEVVLQTIVEKLEAIEISLLKDNNGAKEETIQGLIKEVKSVKLELVKLPLQFGKSTEEMSTLLQSITALNFKLDNQVTEKVKHSHHFHKGIWIAVGLFIFCCLSSYGWIECYNEKQVFEANDIKYRYLKVNGNSNVLKATYSTDSLYNLNRDYFGEKVIKKERDLAKQYELYRIANEKKKEFGTRKVHKDR